MTLGKPFMGLSSPNLVHGCIFIRRSRIGIRSGPVDHCFLIYFQRVYTFKRVFNSISRQCFISILHLQLKFTAVTMLLRHIRADDCSLSLSLSLSAFSPWLGVRMWPFLIPHYLDSHIPNLGELFSTIKIFLYACNNSNATRMTRLENLPWCTWNPRSLICV